MAASDLGHPGTSERLGALVDRVWPQAGVASSPVAVTVGAPPERHVVAETYAVVPDLARARYLVPLGSRRAAVATLWAYHTMRAPKRRAAEAAVSTMFRTGLGDRVFRDRLVVSIDELVPRSSYPDWLVVAHLARELDCAQLFAGLAVRRVQPNAKPMLELYDGEGLAQGFAKLGWSVATKQLVSTEVDALTDLRGRLDRLVVPEPLCNGTFGDHRFSVVTPLARGLRRYHDDPVVASEVPLAVAESTEMVKTPLAGSAYARRLHDVLSSVAGDAPDAWRVTRDWLLRLERSPEPILFGRWHGDWVPHNLGEARQQVAAWDWEHSSTHTPVGFDALHWHYQRSLARSGLAGAVEDAEKTAAKLGGFGVSTSARGLTASLYLLEMFLRAAVQAVGGGGWNPRVYPAMLDVAARRDLELPELT